MSKKLAMANAHVSSDSVSEQPILSMDRTMSVLG